MQASISEFLKPRSVRVQPESGNRARIVIEPFERGFGHTLGNALRRVLLSSMPGAAIVEVEIEGVLHEYTSIEGVQEDVVEILLNLKGVAIRMHSRDRVELTVHRKGPGPVTAGDIVDRSRCGSRQPEAGHRQPHQRRRAEDDADHRAGPWLSRRRYPADQLRGADHRPSAGCSSTPPSARSARSPTTVESARVEQRTDLDKLVLDVETNGTIDAGRSDAPRRHDPQRPAGCVPRAAGPGRGRARPRPSPRSSRSCCVPWTSWSSPCAPPTASRRRTSTTSATSCSARKSSCSARPTSARSPSPRSRKCWRATACRSACAIENWPPPGLAKHDDKAA